MASIVTTWSKCNKMCGKLACLFYTFARRASGLGWGGEASGQRRWQPLARGLARHCTEWPDAEIMKRAATPIFYQYRASITWTLVRIQSTVPRPFGGWIDRHNGALD